MDNLPIIIEKVYSAPVSKVWWALTDEEQMKEWYFDIKDFVPEKGKVYDFDIQEGENLYHHRFVILEVVPEKKLRHTWEHPGHSDGKGILTWLLDSEGNGTKVTLIHEGIENFADGGDGFKKENYIAGWNEILGKWLKDYLEN